MKHEKDKKTYCSNDGSYCSPPSSQHVSNFVMARSIFLITYHCNLIKIPCDLYKEDLLLVTCSRCSCFSIS